MRSLPREEACKRARWCCVGCGMGLGFLTLEDSIDSVLGAATDAWSYCVAIHYCVAIPHCVGISSCVSVSVKREAVIAGLASEGLALLLGSAEAGSSAVVRPTPTDPVEFRKCARDLKALSAATEYTNEERGNGRDLGVRRPGVGRGQFPARSKIFVPHRSLGEMIFFLNFWC